MSPSPRYSIADAIEFLDGNRPVEGILEDLADFARVAIPSHQSTVSLTRADGQWAQAIAAVRLSDKYADYRTLDRPTTGEGIYRLVCISGRSMRLTNEELVNHPAWKGFGPLADSHPPMRGWLAAPLTGTNGENLGLIQLSDRIDGEYSQDDEDLLNAIARVAALAIERADLFEQLGSAEQQLHTALNLASEGLIVLTPTGEVTLANAAVVDVLGTPASESHLAELLQLTGSYEGQQAAQALVTGEAYRGSLSPGDEQHLFIDIPPREEQHPRVVAITDISSLERERAQRSLLDDAVRQSADGLVVLRPIVGSSGEPLDFECLLANDAINELLDQPIAPGDRLSSTFPGPEEHLLPICREVLTTRQPNRLELRLPMRDGGDEWLDVAVSPAQRGIGLSIRRITDQKLTEARLRESEELLNRSQAIAHVGGWQRTPSQNDQLEWTDEVYRIFGMAPQSMQLCYADFLSRVHPDDRHRVDDTTSRVLASRVPFEIDYRALRPDGTVRYVHETGSVIDEASQLLRFVGTIQDVTEKRQMDESLHRAQRLQSLGVMAAGIAHDFNNILGVITIDAGLLQRRMRAENLDQFLELLDSLQMAAGRASDLTQRLLTFTGQQERKVVPVSLDAVIQNLMPMLHSAIGERFLLDYVAEASPVIFGDLTQLEQVILNVVLNSRDAMPEGGAIRMRLTVVDGQEGSRWGMSPNDARGWVHLEVSDTGIGMDAATMQRVYDPFFTTKTGGRGTGLGIPVVFGIMNQSEGRMEITSSPGRGTTVLLAFPNRSGEPAAVVAPHSEEAVSPTGTQRVLLAEDDADMRQVTVMALEELGYDVTTAATSVAARRALSRGRYDVLVADIIMPDEDGASLAESVLNQYPRMCAVLISGVSAPPQLPDPARTSFLAKPFAGEALGRAIQRLVNPADA